MRGFIGPNGPTKATDVVETSQLIEVGSARLITEDYHFYSTGVDLHMFGIDVCVILLCDLSEIIHL